MDICKISTR